MSLDIHLPEMLSSSCPGVHLEQSQRQGTRTCFLNLLILEGKGVDEGMTWIRVKGNWGKNMGSLGVLGLLCGREEY